MQFYSQKSDFPNRFFKYMGHLFYKLFHIRLVYSTFYQLHTCINTIKSLTHPFMKLECNPFNFLFLRLNNIGTDIAFDWLHVNPSLPSLNSLIV